MNDLKHSDWLFFSQQKVIQKMVPSVTTSIRGKKLVISNISEDDLLLLEFFTNTDSNNNYLYLESVNVNLADSDSSLLISGLQDTMLDVYRLSDLNSYLSDLKVHTPFNNTAFNGISVGDFIDNLTSALPTVPDSKGLTKIFTLTLSCNKF